MTHTLRQNYVATNIIIVITVGISQLLFVTEPLSQTAVEGQIVQFDCSVQSDILLTFVWEFTRSGSDVSQVIADLTGPVVPRKYSVINIGHASSRLEVHGIEISDAGSYTCRVTSSSGQTIQADAILEISCKYTYLISIYISCD